MVDKEEVIMVFLFLSCINTMDCPNPNLNNLMKQLAVRVLTQPDYMDLIDYDKIKNNEKRTSIPNIQDDIH